MSRFIINEAAPLKGTVRINGAKNSALPIIAASILADGESVIDEVCNLDDIKVMCELLQTLGLSVSGIPEKDSIRVKAGGLNNTCAPYELVTKMRASFLVMGPLLARMGHAKISLPGGCAIGTRPVDLHLKGFAALGAEISQGHGYIEAKAKKLKGTRIYLDFPSVGATENIMMAASLAEGQTTIENAANEPEIVDLANYLTLLGAEVKGAGTDTIKITGVKSLSGGNHSVIPDRIEAGTFMIGAAISGGDITLENVIADHLKPVTAKLKETGVEIQEGSNSIRVCSRGRTRAVDIKTLPYPGFPTDMQSQGTSLMSVSDGTSVIIETIFENRFMHVGELKRMGARIKIEGRSAIIQGINRLTGARVRATDLRAGAALILAALAAEGTTEIVDIEHIDRGYYKIDDKLRKLGVGIQRIVEDMEEPGRD